MKKILIYSLVLFCTFCSNSIAQDRESLDELKVIANDFIYSISSGDYEKASQYMDSTVKEALPKAQFEQLWASLIGQLGTYSGQVGLRTEQIPNYDVIFVTLQFEKMKIDTKLIFDKENRIAGLFFVPAPPDKEYEPTAYIDTSLFSESEITFGETSWSLPGTLSIPKGDGPFPAVVLVHGSGPNDRDETVGPNRFFKDLAWGLASNGIAVLRYDKRTKVHSMQFGKLDEFTVKEETIDDAVLAFEYLKKTNQIDPTRVYILGHSLGAMLMPRIGQQALDAAGLILMAGNTRPLEDLLVEQFEYIYSLKDSLSDKDKTFLDSLKKQVTNVKSNSFSKDTPAEQTPLGLKASYWLDLKNYNQIETAQMLPQPLLILQGERDYQVTMQDFNEWKKGLILKTNVTFKSYPKLNHLFITGEGKATPDEYLQEGHIEKEVIEDIVKWIKEIL